MQKIPSDPNAGTQADAIKAENMAPSREPDQADDGLRQRCCAEQEESPMEQLIEPDSSPSRSSRGGGTGPTRRCCSVTGVLLILSVVLALELFLKHLAWRRRDEFVLLSLPALNMELSWTFSQNLGAALGIFSTSPEGMRKVLHALTGVIVLSGAIWASRPGRHRLTRMGVACYVFGGLGNFVDRALVSCVVDYLRFKAFYDEWRICFNLSDLCINVGFVLLACRLIRLQ